MGHYGPEDFMCHVLADVAGFFTSRREAYKALEASISKLLQTQNTITLMNYLKATDSKYLELSETYAKGHGSEQCHNYRLAFWRNMVAELESKGL
ncbi:hypothetical protein uav_022 [Pseudomonas phage UAVern]|uniref:Uncharacterized protein n=1 Tax=Pseudomonas phage UAVern TaxID=2856997 RepID=A0A975YYN6_9CAUD|nr:hypothetical protein uav_022 [Pseudomonas phage UAVern]